MITVTINESEYEFPTSLDELTLGKRIEYELQYGRELEARAESIREMPADEEREIEISAYQIDRMYSIFAFFCKFSIDALKASDFTDEIAQIYYGVLEPLFDELAGVEMKYEFNFENETYYLPQAVLQNGSSMTFGEFIDSKQMVKDMVGLKMSKYEYVLPLCVIYLRKKGESYREDMLYENSERLKLFERLPMSVARCVAFFLSSSMTFASKVLESFKKVA